MTTDQCSQLEVLYQESSVEISKNQFNKVPEFFYNWGEEFLISFDFEGRQEPDAVYNILHVYDYAGLFDYDYNDYDYDYEPEETCGHSIPGCRTIQPWNIQPAGHHSACCLDLDLNDQKTRCYF